MKQSSKARRHKPSQQRPAPGSAGTETSPLNASGFDAAQWSSRRGYIYYPTWDTRKELDTYSRLEMIRKARWAKRNIGFVRRCTNGIANMVGSLSPRALTKDREWNRLAEKAYANRAGNALTFDKMGKFNVDGYQNLITRTRFLDGDFLTVLTESDAGGAMVMSYEAHQVRNSSLRGLPVQNLANDWTDGVLSNNLNRPVAYRVSDGNVLTGETKSVDIPASDCILNIDYDSCGWQRAPTHLHCAVNHLLDTAELSSDLKLGSKLANRIGYYVQNQLPRAAGGPPGMGGAAPRQVSNGNGQNYMVEDTFRGGKMLSLEAGQEIKQLLDQRPHPNTLEFLEWLNRDIAWGLGISSDILWNIAKLGGATARYVMADAQQFLQVQQQLLVDQFLTRFWVYFCAKEMKAGRLPKCQDPEWWMVGWTPPAKLTVDIGREGRLSVELHQAGMLTLRRWYDQQGLVLEHELREDVSAYALRVMLCLEAEKEYGFKITPDLVWPTNVGPEAVALPSQEDQLDDVDVTPVPAKAA